MSILAKVSYNECMSDDIANLTLEYLKRFDKRFDRLDQDMQDIKFRVGQIERQVAGIHETLAHHSSLFDRVDDRLSKIEKQLDLVNA